MAEFGSLKVGDICKVIGNSNAHGFVDGEEVELYEIYEHSDWRLKERGVPFFAKTLDGISIYNNIIREVDLERVGKMKEFTKSDLQEFDEVVYRDGGKNIYYQGNFRGGCPRNIYYYNRNLTRDDEHNESDIMKVIRNKEVIWERVEKSPIQIELESLEQQQREIADKIAELSKKV